MDKDKIIFTKEALILCLCTVVILWKNIFVLKSLFEEKKDLCFNSVLDVNCTVDSYKKF